MSDPWVSCVEQLVRSNGGISIPWRAEHCRRFFLSDSPLGSHDDDSTGLVSVRALSDDDFMNAIAGAPGAAVTIGQVSQVLNVERKAARRHLRLLLGKGKVWVVRGIWRLADPPLATADRA